MRFLFWYFLGIVEGQHKNTRRKRKVAPQTHNPIFSVEYGFPWQRLVASGTLDFESRPVHTVFLLCEDELLPHQVKSRFQSGKFVQLT